MKPQDAPNAQYLVVVIHSEWEKTVEAFVSEDNARQRFSYWQDKNTEVYLAKVEKVSGL